MATPTHSTPTPPTEGGAIALLDRYMALTAQAEAAPEAEAEQLDAAARVVEDALMACEVKTAADFAAKAIVATARGEAFPCWQTSPFWTEARALIGGVA